MFRSGCCIRNDGGGCYQTHRDMCSRTLATWLHYEFESPIIQTTDLYRNSLSKQTMNRSYIKMAQTMNPMEYNEKFGHSNLSLDDHHHLPNKLFRLSNPVRIVGKIGPVCGLDPDFCRRPRSVGAFAWSETDVTEWPVSSIRFYFLCK